MNQVQRRQKVIGRWSVEGKLQVLLGHLVNVRGLCSLNVLGSCMRHCSCLSYVCMDKGVMENDERGG